MVRSTRIALVLLLGGCVPPVLPPGDAGQLEPDAAPDAGGLEPDAPDAAACAPDGAEPDDEPRDILPTVEGSGADWAGGTYARTFHAGDAGDWIWADLAEGTGAADGRVRVTAEDSAAGSTVEIRATCRELTGCPGELDADGWCIATGEGATMLDVTCGEGAEGGIEIRVGALPGPDAACEHTLTVTFGAQP